jgi:hypothetical protein
MSAGLRGRIVERISHSVRVRASFVRGSLVGLVLVFLVSVTVIVAVRGPGPTRDGAAHEPQPVLSSGAVDQGEPTPMLTLRRLAEAETVEEIDAILDQYAPRWLVFTCTDREHLFDPGL